MDELLLTEEQKCALFELSAIIAENNKKEQEAVKGYTEQLRVIARARTVCGTIPELSRRLDELEAATQEKTADELSHSRDLNFEYTELTGIQPKED